MLKFLSIKQRFVVFACLLAISAGSSFFLNDRSAFTRNISIPQHETTELDSNSILKIQDLEAQQDEDKDEFFDLTLQEERDLHDASVDIGREYWNFFSKQDKTQEDVKRHKEIFEFKYFIMAINDATTSSYSELFNASQLKYWTPILEYLSSSYKYIPIIPLAIKRCGFNYDIDVAWRKRILTTKTPWCTIDNVKSFVKIDIAIDKFKDWLFPEAAAESFTRLQSDMRQWKIEEQEKKAIREKKRELKKTASLV